MSALSHICGFDLTISSGTIAVVAGAEEVRQRLLRRLCTNPGDYIWQANFGAGLPAMIGDPMDVERIRGVIAAQIIQDPGVDSTEPVSVNILVGSDGRYDCSIAYVDAQNATTQTIGFSS
jgi:phage baseplate assembly protein W